jgi:hypothetical protein
MPIAVNEFRDCVPAPYVAISEPKLSNDRYLHFLVMREGELRMLRIWLDMSFAPWPTIEVQPEDSAAERNRKLDALLLWLTNVIRLEIMYQTAEVEEGYYSWSAT